MIDLTTNTPKTATPEWWEFLPQFMATFNSKLENPKNITVQEYRQGMHNLDKIIVIFKNQKHKLNDESAGDKTQEEIEALFDDLKTLRIKAMEFRRKYTNRGRMQ